MNRGGREGMVIGYCVNVLNASELFTKNSQNGKGCGLCNSVPIHGNICDCHNYIHRAAPPTPPAVSWWYPFPTAQSQGKWACQFFLALRVPIFPNRLGEMGATEVSFFLWIWTWGWAFDANVWLPEYRIAFSCGIGRWDLPLGSLESSSIILKW